MTVAGGTARIGVLGGIGPESTAEFYSMLISKLQEKGFIKTNQDYPQIIINSIPAPELIHTGISDGDLEPYIQALKELDKVGVDFIVMVCNTIHLFYNELQEKIKTHILDLRKELRKVLIKKNIRTVSILGTPSTVKNGLYKFNGIKYINPTGNELKQISNSVFGFNKGVEKTKQIEAVRRIYEKYYREVDAVVLGCTELAVMLGGKKNTIDTIDVLVDSTIDRASLHLADHAMLR